MQTIHIQGKFAGEEVDITVTSNIDPKSTASFVLNFYENMIDQVTESRLTRITTTQGQDTRP
jgi:hypothetical protein